MINKIKLMADYTCHPLWWVSSDKVGDINPETLPLSKETIRDLKLWAAAYDNTLNWDDPASSTPATTDEKLTFEKEGIRLWQQLQKELPSHIYMITYFSEVMRRTITDINQIDYQGINE